MSIELFCWGCGLRPTVGRVTAAMRHTCGSENLDLWEGTPAQKMRAEALRQELRPDEPVFSDFMRRTATEEDKLPEMAEQTPRQEGDVPGWNVYKGPPPEPNPRQAPAHTTPGAPTTHMPGVVDDTNLYVYDKNDPWDGTGENPPPPQVARHNYPSTQTSIPFLGRRKDEQGVPLKGASCPSCGAHDTALIADDREDAHWSCTRKCGSLVNLDRHPTVDPYRPPAQHPWGADTFKRGRRLLARKKTGALLRRAQVIHQANPGLRTAEIVHLARQSIIQYPEA